MSELVSMVPALPDVMPDALPEVLPDALPEALPEVPPAAPPATSPATTLAKPPAAQSVTQPASPQAAPATRPEALSATILATGGAPSTVLAGPRQTRSQRRQRYRAILDQAVDRPWFALDELKRVCGPERPATVTRLVNELAAQGWVIRETEDEPVAYRWNADRGAFSTQRWLDAKLNGDQVKTQPVHERPREKLLARGAENLTNAELLAILIRSGRPGESAVSAGQKVARTFEGRLGSLAGIGRAELKDISAAVNVTGYCQILAGIELGRRAAAAMADETPTPIICTTRDAIAFCQRHFERLARDARQEEFHIVTLDTKNRVIQTHQITVGTLDASLVHPREVFRPAIRDAAASVILLHNHPSGDPAPSPEDHAVTRRLERAGETIGIDVLDHIIVARRGSTSLRAGR